MATACRVGIGYGVRFKSTVVARHIARTEANALRTPMLRFLPTVRTGSFPRIGGGQV